MNLSKSETEAIHDLHQNLQETHDGHLAIPVKVERVVVSQFGSQVDHRERGGILQGVGQVLSPPIRCSPTGFCPSSPHIFCQTLTQSDRTWECHNNGHYQVGSTSTVRLGSSGQSVGEEHAKTDVEIPQHARITCQGIRQQNITKLAILRLCQATNSNPFQGQEEPNSAGPRGSVERPDQNEEQDNEDRLRDEIEAFHKLCGPARSNPEHDKPEEERNREERRQSVNSDMVWPLRGGRVSDERRDVLINEERHDKPGTRTRCERCHHLQYWPLPAGAG